MTADEPKTVPRTSKTENPTGNAYTDKVEAKIMQVMSAQLRKNLISRLKTFDLGLVTVFTNSSTLEYDGFLTPLFKLKITPRIKPTAKTSDAIIKKFIRRLTALNLEDKKSGIKKPH